ncbi:sulfotransferase [Parasphingopyxis sp.]|uniref:sulfotransferase n=1 Tax=Parasphingopyxis sp. TaxID=1920299 RepID=UPI002601D43F|nr:sulfotransferase [Parasphingopyxis sp.]
MKKFILGMGAQKAGTTWVHDYLNDHDNSEFGFAKEYHFFDLYAIDSLKPKQKRLISSSLRKLNGSESISESTVLHKLAWFNDPSYYFSYFENILRNPETAVTGDLTPTYSGLPASVLNLIHKNFLDRGIEVWPIFLMRDPVDRLKSRVKMYFRKKRITPSYEEEIKLMKKLCRSEEVKVRASYSDTYKNMREVYGENCFVGFYETLFSDAETKRLCDIIGINHHQPNFDRKLNVSDSPNILSENDIAYFKDIYADQYAFAGREFGSEFIGSIWR